jgi:hypothetical protein
MHPWASRAMFGAGAADASPNDYGANHAGIVAG